MKNQIKKSLSLFLAILMVLSCWVWVAPTEAEAASTSDASASFTPTDQYKVRLGYTLNNNCGKDGYVEFKVWYMDKNGRGTSAKTTIEDHRLYTGSDGKYYQNELTLSGFPYYIECATYRSDSGTVGQNEICWDEVSVSNGDNPYVDLFTDQFTISQRTGQKWSVAKAWLLEGYSAQTSDADATHTQPGKFKPAIIGFDSASAPDNLNLDLNNVDTNGNVSGSVAFTVGTYFDQYGVKWTADTKEFMEGLTKTAYISTSATGDPLSTEEGSAHLTLTSAAPGASTENYTATVQANKELPSVVAKSSGEYTGLNVVYKWSGTNPVTEQVVDSSAYATFKVTYPSLFFKFDAAGSIPNFTPSFKYKEGDQIKDATGTLTVNGVIGSKITKIPTGEATADGYEFKGFWTVNQPTSGKASFNAKEDEFAEPISSETFAQYKANGGTVDKDDEKYIEYNDKLYYNAGTEWSTEDTTMDVERTYYGWWLAEAVTLKFYDIDGKFLGEQSVKVGQTYKDVTWPTPTQSYTSGSFQYSNFSGKWANTDGLVVDQTKEVFNYGFLDGRKTLILTPKYTVSFTNKYKVNFINPNNGSNLTGSADYDYRAEISSKKPANQAVPGTIANAIDYSYEFKGWTTIKPTTGLNYHVMLEDGDFDVNGTQIVLNEDWIVRDTAAYYAVYRRYAKSYVVNFKYIDSTGAEATKELIVKYGSTLVPPTDAVPYSYVSKGYGYTFNAWKYSDVTGEEEYKTLGYNATLPFTREYIDITAAAYNDGVNVQPIVFIADYKKGAPTPYTVTFSYVNENGEEVTTDAEVKNEEFITEEILANINPYSTWENDDALYTFKGNWEIVDGAAADGSVKGDIINTADLTKISPTSNIVLKAVYEDPQNYYTVTYVDGANKEVYRELDGADLPDWVLSRVEKEDGTFETNFYTPSKADDAKGSYVFQGWYDAPQADAEYKVTNGNRYGSQGAASEAGITKVTGNVTLYPQFKFVPFKYTITFLDYKGEMQLASYQFEYGQNIEMLIAEAERAARSRDADPTYKYTFIGWDKAVPTTCEGRDMTFIAVYKAEYIYYQVKWYNSKLVDGEWVADKSTTTNDEGKTIETNLLATTNHTYEGKLYTPAVNTVCLETAPAGQNYGFIGWFYKTTEDGVEVEKKYERGMTVTGAMEFYAKYELSDKLYTVTTVVKDDTDPDTYQVPNGSPVSIPDPDSGYVNAEKHNEFDGWYTDAERTQKFDMDTEITADITLYAKFTESDHDYSNSITETNPTYFADGKKVEWCSCDKDKTFKETKINKLTDEVKPTGTIYLGTLGSWASTDEVGAAATDGNEIEFYANADTNVIITANDTGVVDELYNPSGSGIGLKFIKAFAFDANTVFNAENFALASQIATIVAEAPYETDDEGNKIYEVHNTANYSIKLGELKIADLDEDGKVQYENGEIKTKDLVNGEAYIIYYNVVDLAGNELNTKVRTAKFIYDAEAPSITISGDSNADKNVAVATYCGAATISVPDATYTVVNAKNEAVEVENNTITAAGTYLVTATDKANNKTTLKFKVAAHDYVKSEKTGSCTIEGYKKEICSICGDTLVNETYEAVGHIWGMSALTPSTCTTIGYSVTTCDVCGETVKNMYEVDANGEFVLDTDGKKIPLFPITEHEYAKDEDGNIIYETVVEATCSSVDKKVARCTICGGAEIVSEEQATNPSAHKFGTTKTLAATCTQTGKKYKICKYCGEEEIIETLGVTGHTVEWTVEKAATCGTAGTMIQKCTVCKASVGEATAYDWVDVADGNYAYVYKTDKEGNFELDENGDKIIVTDRTLDLTTGTLNTYYQIYRLPAQGQHDYEITTTEATTQSAGKTVYKCKVCGFSKTVVLDKLVEYTVTFLNEDKTEYAKVTVGSGASANVTAPTKAATAEKTFTFAGWVDADGKKVELPVEVTADMTLTATFKETKILYTHKFVAATTYTLQDVATIAEEEATAEWVYGDEVEIQTLVGAIGDIRKTSIVPTIAATELYTFEFLGWYTRGGAKVEDFAVAGDAEFVAKFKANPVNYSVVYYSEGDFVWSTTVEGGKPVVYNNTVTGEDGTTTIVYPTKKYDDDNHYAFAAWCTDEAATTEYAGAKITADTRLYAKYEATAHTWTITNTVAATCTTGTVTDYACACGATKTVKSDDALGHDQYKKDADGNYILVDGEKVINSETVEENGKYYIVIKCSACDDIIEKTENTVTIKFKTETGLSLGKLSLSYGEAVEFDGDEPTKEATAEFTFAFVGWYVEGDESKTVIATLPAATENVTYIAAFTGTKRSYNVSYVDSNNKVIWTDTLEYGEAIPAYTGAEPVKSATKTDHFVFTGWSVEAGTEVTGSVIIKPNYDTIPHDWKETDEVKKPTCTEVGGKLYICKDCDYENAKGAEIAALGHKIVVANKDDYDYINGQAYEYYVCANDCGMAMDPAKALIKNVAYTETITDEGATIANTIVTLYKDGEPLTNKATDANGNVTFYLYEEGVYEIKLLDRVLSKVSVDGKLNLNDKVDETPETPDEPEEPSCSCACHKNSFWGIIYRLFQKLIKVFTGEIACCSDPDHRY